MVHLGLDLGQLHLVVTEQRVSGSILDENDDWQPIGSIPINGLDLYPYLGLGAYNGISEKPTTSIPVDFDFIQAQPIEIEFSAVYLPFVTQPLPP